MDGEIIYAEIIYANNSQVACMGFISTFY